ncbi:unnamed protein product [Amoebophrya sp. A120]|nr:unnamed protein product [Amoebophrya sp. A120]|eukprot:GSA120T00018739001.1
MTITTTTEFRSDAEAVEAWTRTWFSPEFEPYRFSAQKPSAKKVFDDLHASFGGWFLSTLVSSETDNSSSPLEQSSSTTGLLLRLRTAVFLDQTVRNIEPYWERVREGDFAGTTSTVEAEPGPGTTRSTSITRLTYADAKAQADYTAFALLRSVFGDRTEGGPQRPDIPSSTSKDVLKTLLPEIHNIFEVCFWSLVARHQRSENGFALAKTILTACREVVAERSSLRKSESEDRELALLDAFIEKTEQVELELEAERYVDYALSEAKLRVCVPRRDGMMSSDEEVEDDEAERAVVEARLNQQNDATSTKNFCGGPLRDKFRYLDPQCVPEAKSMKKPDEIASDPFPFAPAWNASCYEKTRSSLRNYPLVKDLERVLRTEQSSATKIHPSIFNSANTGIVLSLSGGVDSIVHAALLSILKPEFKGKVSALHLRHCNRQEQKHEEFWVRELANRLGIPLYAYTIELQRPHGDLKTGLSRERYEEVTKKIRFKMYENCFEEMKTENNFVIIGHHQDDVDENRIAELLKGSVVHINGVETFVKIDNLLLCRPLLERRKQEFFDFAKEFQLCYMRDSTPKWSRRGCIRQLLDWNVENENLQEELKLLGDNSTELGVLMDETVKNWKMKSIRRIEDAADAQNDEDDEKNELDEREAAKEKPIYALDLGELMDLAEEVAANFTKVVEQIEQFRSKWNPILEKYATEVNPAVKSALQPIPGHHCSDFGPQRGNGKGTRRIAPQKSDGNSSGAAGPFLFTRAMYAAQGSSGAASSSCDAEVVPVQKNRHRAPKLELINNQKPILLGKKALHHAWQACVKARANFIQNGNLHKEVGYRYLPKRRVLLVQAGNAAELQRFFEMEVMFREGDEGEKQNSCLENAKSLLDDIMLAKRTTSAKSQSGSEKLPLATADSTSSRAKLAGA